ncbi:MAG TPA: glycosyltransferase family 9 protein [Chitinispirillaceae bacterium]|nr:glycosyltransferase family 9 protein [Chitinispirillaceae bacterium]
MTDTLVILPNNLGDVIMALPVIESLKNSDPISSITFFVEDGFEDGVINHPSIDHLFLFPRKQIKQMLNSPQWQDGITILKKYIDDLNNTRFDRIVNLCQHSYTAALVSQLFVPALQGRHFLPQGYHAIKDVWSRYLYSIPYSRQCNMLHAVDVYKYIAGVAGVPGPGTIALTSEEAERSMQLLHSEGMPAGAQKVLIHPGAAYQSKMWPIEHYITLTQKLIDQGYWVIITGSPDERDIAETIKQNAGEKCICAAGKLSFRESVSLVSLTKFCITADTAMMHAAAAVGIRVYALFGPTNPVETGPYGKNHIVFAGRCPSRPCFCFECKNKMCMKSISPETVFNYITTGACANATCDIYITTIKKDSTFGIIPLYENGPSYYYKPYAEMTRKLLDHTYELTSTNDEINSVKFDINEFSISLQSIEIQLSSFIENSNHSHIQQYEKLRVELEKVNKLSCFLTAFLNTGLNSIPLLNLRAGVQKSLQICQELRLKIQDTLHAL